MNRYSSRSGELMLGFVAGMTLGYAVALLMAPDRGTGTREALKNRGLNLLDKLLGQFEGQLGRLESSLPRLGRRREAAAYDGGGTDGY
jgi:hypothetical protein